MYNKFLLYFYSLLICPQITIWNVNIIRSIKCLKLHFFSSIWCAIWATSLQLGIEWTFLVSLPSFINFVLLLNISHAFRLINPMQLFFFNVQVVEENYFSSIVNIFFTSIYRQQFLQRGCFAQQFRRFWFVINYFFYYIYFVISSALVNGLWACCNEAVDFQC